MIVEDIIAFQDAIKSKTEMNDKFFDKITQKFQCFLINNEQDVKNEISTNEKETRVMIIDRITELDPYFLVIFNNTIIFISDLLLLQKIIPDFEEYRIFTFSENLDTDFPEEFQNLIYQYDDLEKKIFLITIDNFSKYFDSVPKKKQFNQFNQIWEIIQKSFFSYLINKSNQEPRQNESNIYFNENDFIKLQQLGTGSSSMIRLVFHIENEKFYALKIIQNCSTSYDREYDFYSNIHHPLIPRFYGKMNIEDKYGLIIEYINGKKLNEIDCRKLTDEDRFYIIMQLMITVEYIHLNKFICRDLKPDNLIVDKNKNLILIDFDQSINFKKSR